CACKSGRKTKRCCGLRKRDFPFWFISAGTEDMSREEFEKLHEDGFWLPVTAKADGKIIRFHEEGHAEAFVRRHLRGVFCKVVRVTERTYPSFLRLERVKQECE